MQRSIIAPAERVTNLRWAMAAVVAFASLAGSFGAGVIRHQAVPLPVPIAIGILGIGAGIAVDRFGSRIAGAIVMALGATAVFLDLPGFANEVLLFVKIVVGAIILSLLARWFPRREVPRAAAIVVVSSLIGGAAGPTCSFFLRDWSNGIGALLMILAGALIFFFSREPRDGATWLTYAEQTYIATGGADPAAAPSIAAYVATVRSANVWLVTFACGALSYGIGLTLLTRPSFYPDRVRAVVEAIVYWAIFIAARRACPRLTSGFVGAALGVATLAGGLIAVYGPGEDAVAAFIATGISILCTIVVLMRRSETEVPGV